MIKAENGLSLAANYDGWLDQSHVRAHRRLNGYEGRPLPSLPFWKAADEFLSLASPSLDAEVECIAQILNGSSTFLG